MNLGVLEAISSSKKIVVGKVVGLLVDYVSVLPANRGSVYEFIIIIIGVPCS